HARAFDDDIRMSSQPAVRSSKPGGAMATTRYTSWIPILANTNTWWTKFSLSQTSRSTRIPTVQTRVDFTSKSTAHFPLGFAGSRRAGRMSAWTRWAVGQFLLADCARHRPRLPLTDETHRG